MKWLWAATCVVVLAGVAPAIAALPKPSGYVNDFAGVIDPATRAELDRVLRQAERTTSAEIAVATVTSLDGVSIEEYANRLFREWGIGKKSADNGVLILIAPTQRTMRIEVGYGLEAVLPDGLAGEIIRTDFLPGFRRGEYASAILTGTQHVVELVRRQQPAPADARRPRTGQRQDLPPLVFVIPFLGVFVVVGCFVGGLGVRTRTFGALVFASLFSAVPTVIGAIERRVPAFWMLPALGAGAFAWGYRKGGSAYWRETLRGPMRAGDESTAWTMGATGSGSSSGDSGSSGGDFGGGSSGGGGASGSW